MGGQKSVNILKYDIIPYMAIYKEYAHSFHCKLPVTNKVNNVLLFKGERSLHILCIFSEIYLL